MKILKNWSDIGINIKTDGNSKYVCPCANDRKNKRDKSLSINGGDNIGYCHHCGETYRIYEPSKVWVKPEKPTINILSKKTLDYLHGRGITDDVIKRNKLAELNGNLLYPYFKNGELINYKVKAIDKSIMFQAKEAEPILYKLDQINGSDKIIICEGEEDAMSFQVAGYDYSCSVNAGAPNANDKSVNKKLECIDTCFDVLNNAKVVYIAVDMDDNGQRLKEELIRRIGIEKCLIVIFPSGCKDANDVLVKHGVDALKKCYDTADKVRMSGVFTIGDFKDEMINAYKKGKERGTTTHIKGLDEFFTWRKGEVNLWTGYMNEGKSTFLRYLAILKCFGSKWKWAVFAPEDYPICDFFDDIIHTLMGKTSDKYFNEHLTEEEYKMAIDDLSSCFYIIKPIETDDIDTLLKLMSDTIRRFGVDGVILDPYNQIEHMIYNKEPEHLYISKFMKKLKRFAVDLDVSVNLVAHQVTPIPDFKKMEYPKPSVYRIKGGGTFADKCDNAMIIWQPERLRDFKDDTVIFESQKIKKRRLVGTPGQVKMRFNIIENRYEVTEITQPNEFKTFSEQEKDNF